MINNHYIQVILKTIIGANMDNKSKIILILTVVIIILCSIFIFHQDSQKGEIGNTYFDLPNGFHEKKIQSNHVNITNGDVALLFTEYGENITDINVVVNYYITTKKNESLKCDLNEKMMNNTKVYKTTISNNTNIMHYWFIKNGRIYEISTHNGNSNTDNIVQGIINSMTTNPK